MRELPGYSYTKSDIPQEYVSIGKFCGIAEDVKFMVKEDHACVIDRDMVTCYAFHAILKLHYMNESETPVTKGPIIIKNDVWIGEGARILSNLTIGDGATIATKAVVTKDVPPYSLVAGNPARVKKYRFNKEQIRELLKIRWWDWPYEKIRDNLNDFLNIHTFLRKYAVAD